MQTVVEQIAVRLPPGMRARLKEVAAARHRSVNAQVVAFLEDALEKAAGGEVGARTPAAGDNNAALERGASITNG